MVTSPGLALGCFAPWLPHAVEVLLQDLASDIYGLLSNKQLLSLSLSQGYFFGLKAGQVQGLQGAEWWVSQKMEETLVSARC